MELTDGKIKVAYFSILLRPKLSRCSSSTCGLRSDPPVWPHHAAREIQAYHVGHVLLGLFLAEFKENSLRDKAYKGVIKRI